MSKLLDPAIRKQIGETYCRLMIEILIRVEIVLNVVNNNPIPQTLAVQRIPTSHQLITGESCYLQLRMICELIALACLTARGDIQETQQNKLKEAYQADRIINALTRLHPDFYPMPSKQSPVKINGRWEKTYLKDGFLTKQELASLYHESGGFLHCGKLADIASRKDRLPDMKRIEEHCLKVWRLLEHHEMQLIDQRYQIIALMKDKVTGKPPFSFAEKIRSTDWVIRDAIALT
jgi:hypothetical protein